MKYAVRCQMKPRILMLSIRRSQSNFSTVFIFVSCKEKDNYHVVLIGQLGFDSHCMKEHHGGHQYGPCAPKPMLPRPQRLTTPVASSSVTVTDKLQNARG